MHGTSALTVRDVKSLDGGVVALKRSSLVVVRGRLTGSEARCVGTTPLVSRPFSEASFCPIPSWRCDAVDLAVLGALFSRVRLNQAHRISCVSAWGDCSVTRLPLGGAASLARVAIPSLAGLCGT